MQIKDIKKLEIDTKGFTVKARVLNTYESKEYKGQYGAFTKQSVQLIGEDDEKIFIRLSNNFISRQDIGNLIEVTDCTLDSYKDELKLETSKDSKVIIANGEKKETQKRTAPSEDIAPPKKFEELIDKAINEVNTIITRPEFKTLMETAKERGLSTEDMRAFLMNRLIHSNI